MFCKNDKKKLYWLIDQYLSNQISARTFCDEYYHCYDLELERTTLNDHETQAFSDLSKIVNRFTEFTEDLQQYPGVYFNEEQLKQKAIETKKILHSR